MTAHVLKVFLVMSLLTGCGTLRAQREQQLALQDDAKCKSIGALPGTDAYTNCRLKLAELHQSEVNAVLSTYQRPRSCSTYTYGGNAQTNCY